MRGTATRFPFDAGDEFMPVWSPDDARIVYSAIGKGPGDIMIKNASGTGSDQPLIVSGVSVE